MPDLMNTKKAVTLLSGGLDSATAAAIAASEGYTLYCLSFDYGQRHKQELESAALTARSLGSAQHMVLSADMRKLGGSALTSSSIHVPKDRNTHEMESGGVPVTYVPARNTIFLSYALAWAEVLGSSDIFIGVNAVDYSGYPDCRPEFITAFERLANLSTKASVEGGIDFKIHAPLIHMTKAEIIQMGEKLGVDFSLTWSCYHPDAEGYPCGRCDSCKIRAKGFREAGVIDHAAKKRGQKRSKNELAG